MSSLTEKLKRHTQDLLVYAVFFLLATLSYSSILNNTFIGDDYGLSDKASNATFPNFWPFFTINKVSFRPFANILLWIQNNLFGIEGLPSHLFTVGLHAGSACLLFWILGSIGIRRNIAYLIAILFILAPVGPEAVTWSVVRFDALVLFFMLLTLGLYVAYLKNQKTATFVGAVAAAAAGIFSKESALTLLLLIPVMDFLLGDLLAEASGEARNHSLKDRLTQIVARLLPFIGVFVIYFAIRFLAIGKVLGGYPNVPTIGRPSLRAMAQSAWTILSPLNDTVFSQTATVLFGICAFILLVASLAAVALLWRQTSALVRRAWIFFVVFFMVALTPVYHRVFMAGAPENLRDSRYLYIPMLGFIAFVVIGLTEFGWKSRLWRIPVLTSLLIAIPVSFYCLYYNNTAWERAALISYEIPVQAQQLLPDPPPGARLYFENVPDWSGAYVYINGLPAAIRWQYNRQDLEVTKLKDGVEPPREDNVFVFVYNEGMRRLSLITGN